MHLINDLLGPTPIQFVKVDKKRLCIDMWIQARARKDFIWIRTSIYVMRCNTDEPKMTSIPHLFMHHENLKPRLQYGEAIHHALRDPVDLNKTDNGLDSRLQLPWWWRCISGHNFINWGYVRLDCGKLWPNEIQNPILRMLFHRGPHPQQLPVALRARLRVVGPDIVGFAMASKK